MMLNESQAYDLGVDAYLYFFPLVLMELTRRQTTNLPPGQRPGFGPANSFSHMRAYPTADFRAVVRPNFDTLYSSGWVDLTAGPVVLSVPDFADRYYLLPILDMWTDVIAVPGWRTTGTKAQDFVITLPGHEGHLPPHMVPIQANTNHLWIIGRIKTDGPDDYRAVHTLQDQLKLTPLSQWGKKNVDQDIKIDPDPTIDMQTPPLDAILKMSHQEYFDLANHLLLNHKPHFSDWSLVIRLKLAGLSDGPIYQHSWSTATRLAFERGASDALKMMKAKTMEMGTKINGWIMNTNTIGVYGNYYLKRAIVALIGLGANQPEDAIYPLCTGDANGQAIVGGKKYILHFDKEHLPPVAAFWSVTMYDADGFQVANSLNRFAISSWMPLNYNQDGSLDIYIQPQSPGSDQQSNWLPSPDSGVLGITMRLYAPNLSALNGDWAPPAIQAI